MVSRESRKNQITAQRREQILNAATAIFSQKGYAAATVPELARLANIAIGTIYIYYPSKRELFVAATQRLIITAPLLKLIERLPEAGFAVTFKGVLQDRLSFMESDNTSRLLSMLGEIQRDPELKALYVERLVKPITSRMAEFYRSGMAAGEFRQVAPDIVARALYGMIIGLVILKSLEGDAGPLSRLRREEIADELSNLLSHGLLKEKKANRNLRRKRRQAI